MFSSRVAMPPTAAAQDKSSITDTKQALKKLTSHSSTAQMDVPHTHGPACCWYCWVLLGACFLALCSLGVGCALAVFMGAQNTGKTQTECYLWYARMICTYILGLRQNVTYVK